MKRGICLILMSAVFVVSGCAGELKPNSVEDVALVTVVGVDYVDESEMKLTMSMPQPTRTVKEQVQVYTTTASLLKQGIVNISAQADKEIKMNGLRIVIFNEEFARSGRMWELVEHLYRNAVTGGSVHIVVVKDSAEELLRGEYPEKVGINTYLNDLFRPKKHNMFSPNTTIHDFIYTQTNPVFDTLTPYIEKRGGLVEITNVALFDEEKMIQLLTRDDGFIIEMLKGASRIPAHMMTLKEDGSDREEVVFDAVESEVNYSSNKSVDQPALEINVKLKGSIYEYQGPKNLSEPEDFKQLEKEIREFTEKEIMTVLEDLKELQVDPIGLSEQFRRHHHGQWTKELTHQIVQNAEYKINVELQVLSTGTLR